MTTHEKTKDNDDKEDKDLRLCRGDIREIISLKNTLHIPCKYTVR